MVINTIFFSQQQRHHGHRVFSQRCHRSRSSTFRLPAMPVIIHGGAMSPGSRIRTNSGESNGRAAPPVSVTRDVMELLLQLEGKPVGERDIEIESALIAQIPRLVIWLSRRAAGEAAQIEQVRAHLGMFERPDSNVREMNCVSERFFSRSPSDHDHVREHARPFFLRKPLDTRGQARRHARTAPIREKVGRVSDRRSFGLTRVARHPAARPCSDHDGWRRQQPRAPPRPSTRGARSSDLSLRASPTSSAARRSRTGTALVMALAPAAPAGR